MMMVVNGAILPAPEDRMTELPPGEGVFETLLIREGAPVFFDEHWTRFEAGCRWLGMVAPATREELAGCARQLAQANQVRTGVLRFAAWRQDQRIEWRAEVGPPRLHMAKVHFTMADGGPVLPLAGPDRGCKHLGREQWTAARRVARTAGWDEVLLGDLAGRLVEAGGSNVFFVMDGVLHTPSLAVGPLPGIMRAKVLALAGAQGWPVREGEFSVRDLEAASEIWLTNSLIGVRPVATFAGRQLDSAHPVLHRLREAWREAHGWDPMVIVNHGQ